MKKWWYDKNHPRYMALTNNEGLNEAHKNGILWSGCHKVRVGAIICPERNSEQILARGANRTRDCATQCNRIAVLGSDSKEHRLSGYCGAVHAEIDALTHISRHIMEMPIDCIMYVTRYPCEECAKAIVNAGYIREVVYGRKTPISDRTEQIFANAGIIVVHADWDAEDRNT